MTGMDIKPSRPIVSCNTVIVSTQQCDFGF